MAALLNQNAPQLLPVISIATILVAGMTLKSHSREMIHVQSSTIGQAQGATSVVLAGTYRKLHFT